MAPTLANTHTQVDGWDDENHFVDEYMRAVEKLHPFGVRSTVLRLTFEQAIMFFPDNFFDLVYIDGYASTGQDGGQTIRDWFRKVAPGGMLAGHDYHPSKWPLTYRNVNSLAQQHNLTVLLTGACDDGYASWAITTPDEEEKALRDCALGSGA